MANNTNNCPTPGPEMMFNQHRFDVNENGGICRYCGHFQARANEERMDAPSRDWKRAAAGYTFSEDLNADGSLPSDE